MSLFKKDIRTIEHEVDSIIKSQKNNLYWFRDKFKTYEDCLEFIRKGRKGPERGIIWDVSDGLSEDACCVLIDIYRNQILVCESCISELTKIQEALLTYKLMNNYMVSLSEFKNLQKDINKIVKINLKMHQLIANEALDVATEYTKKYKNKK